MCYVFILSSSTCWRKARLLGQTVLREGEFPLTFILIPDLLQVTLCRVHGVKLQLLTNQLTFGERPASMDKTWFSKAIVPLSVVSFFLYFCLFVCFCLFFAFCCCLLVFSSIVPLSVVSFFILFCLFVCFCLFFCFLMLFVGF